MTVYRGWQGEIKVDGNTVAQVEGWSVDVDNSAEAHFAVGSRTATDITVGPKNVTGSLSKVWFNDTYADLAANPNDKPASFTFVGKIGGAVSVTCRGCIWSTEDLDFIAKNIDT